MNDITVNTLIYVAVAKENFPYLNSLFKDESDNAWEMIGKSHIPAKRIQNINILAYIQLLYLAKNPEKSPFTERQLKIIQRSNLWNFTTSWSLRVCFVINELLCIGIGFSPLFPTTNNSSESSNYQVNVTTSSFTPIQQGILSTALVVIAVTTALSFWSTGFSPNFLSNSSNATQDILDGVKDTFDNLAGRLVQLYFSQGQKEAIQIAHNICLENLRKGLVLSAFLSIAGGALTEKTPPKPTTIPLPWESELNKLTEEAKPQAESEQPIAEKKKKKKKKFSLENELELHADQLFEHFFK